MKILQINKFWYPHGGADVHAIELAALLASHGHEIGFFGMQHPKNIKTGFENYFIPERHSTKEDFLARGNVVGKIKEALHVVYSRDAAQRLDALLRDFKPAIAHLHNIYHHLSPSILGVLKRHRIPVVHTLHDYKRLCPNHAMFTEGRVCERCKSRRYWNAVRYKCIFDSRIASSVVATEMATQSLFGWYDNYIDHFIASSSFMREKLAQWGRRTDNVSVINNWVHAPDVSLPATDSHVLYYGRLSEEKGIKILFNATVALPTIFFDIVGEGPMREWCDHYVKKHALKNVALHGFKTRQEIRNIATHASCAVLPAIWYENYPLSLLEMAAEGKALIGSQIGGIPEIIEHEVNGLLVPAGNVKALIIAIQKMQDKKIAADRGKNARERVQEENNPQRIILQIEHVYEKVITRIRGQKSEIRNRKIEVNNKEMYKD